MLDIKFIRENRELVEKSAKAKGYDVDVTKIIVLDKEILEGLADLQPLREKRNKNAADSKGGKPSQEEIAEGKRIREEIVTKEGVLGTKTKELDDLLRAAPNIIPDDTPEGGEESNQPIKTWGDAKAKKVKDHLTWAEERGMLDFERGAKVAGNKFYYMKAGLVELELALLQFALDFVKQKGYYPMTVPHMVNTKTLEGAGFSARGNEKQIYKIKDEDLNMIATAEIPLTGFFAGEILPNEWMPSRMAAWSPSYRVEGGAYGKHNRGLFRTHQFNKVELYVYAKPEESEAEHQKLLEVEEEICQALEIPYQVVRIAAGDLGAPAYKKFDINYWSPAEGEYRELMSCSNCTDYQARRLNIRYKTADSKNEFVHTLNATAAAMSRLIIAIIENHQDEQGKVHIPKALQKYMSGQTEL